MLRVLLGGLLLTSLRRPRTSAIAYLHQHSAKIGLSPTGVQSASGLFATCGNLRIMEQPFEKMEEEGLPQCEGGKEREMKEEEEEKALPKLSRDEFRKFNALAEKMNYFHEHFRQTWTTLYTAAASGKRPHGMSIKTFLATAADFAHHLTIHHQIEEQHIFPVLARKMPAFQKELLLLTQHKKIHEGLDQFEAWVAECRSGEREVRMEELRGIMDGFGAVLWEHLDEEVRELGAENMRRYWTVEEMRRIPF